MYPIGWSKPTLAVLSSGGLSRKNDFPLVNEAGHFKGTMPTGNGCSGCYSDMVSDFNMITWNPVTAGVKS